jgi:hypothetical protein
MRDSHKSRAVITREMSLALGFPLECSIPKDLLNDCLRSRKRGRAVRFPAAWVPALCQVIGSDELQRHLLGERLRSLLAIGEDVAQSARSLKRAQEAVARIMEQGKEKTKAVKR